MHHHVHEPPRVRPEERAEPGSTARVHARSFPSSHTADVERDQVRPLPADEEPRRVRAGSNSKLFTPCAIASGFAPPASPPAGIRSRSHASPFRTQRVR